MFGHFTTLCMKGLSYSDCPITKISMSHLFEFFDTQNLFFVKFSFLILNISVTTWRLAITTTLKVQHFQHSGATKRNFRNIFWLSIAFTRFLFEVFLCYFYEILSCFWTKRGPAWCRFFSYFIYILLNLSMEEGCYTVFWILETKKNMLFVKFVFDFIVEFILGAQIMKCPKSV